MSIRIRIGLLILIVTFIVMLILILSLILNQIKLDQPILSPSLPVSVIEILMHFQSDLVLSDLLLLLELVLHLDLESLLVLV